MKKQKKFLKKNFKKIIKKFKSKKLKIKSKKSKPKKTKKVEPVNLKNVVDEFETKIPKKRKKKTPSNKMYFTSETEEAIIKYNSEVDESIRNEIYNKSIKYPFEKLAENIFNTFKFSYFETSPLDVQKETITHLVANIQKYDPSKGKAFAYFSIIAKHFLIFLNNSNYKRFNQNVEIAEGHEEHTVQLQHTDSHHKNQETSEFMNMMIDFWEKNVNKIFTKNRDLNIANAIIEILRQSDRIDAFNKKALYLYIREISSCKTQQITKVINKMKIYQDQISKKYLNNGYL